MSAPTTTTTTSPPSPRRRRIVGVSTKMYFSASQTSHYITSLLSLLSSSPPATLSLLRSRVDIFFIPDHLTLLSSITALSSPSAPAPVPEILPGAQDAHHADAGPYTGEVSPRVLAELGCRLLEINHAERRRLFGETDASAALKVEAAARNAMTPLLCVGEVTRPAYLLDSPDSPESPTADQVEAGAAAAADEIAARLGTLLSRLDPAADAVLAYEPVWAIGAARPAGADHVVGVARRLRRLECVARRTGTTRIVYGGSAGPGLFAKLARGGGGGGGRGEEEVEEEGEEEGDAVDGLFLGRFAHDPEQFYKTILEVAEA
ncbi:mitochondrial triosephosphate isomerase [Biscogniauxia mediterranea]|nr:mitochondrial triosephosphate isomerase [Biscogniauxia mediterranea]